MIERRLQLPRPGGAMETFAVHPSGEGKFPSVILYMDMWGMRATLEHVARRIAAAGYYCILPDLYYRGGRIRYAAHDIPGRQLNFAALEPAHQTALRAAMDGLSDAMVIEDTAYLLDFMRDQPVLNGPVGAVGYCMGGRHALCVAGTFPQRFKATACLHGAGLVSAGEHSPHLIARQAAGEIYCGHAELDRYAPPDVVARLDDTFTGCAVRYQRRVHIGAEHGYALSDRDVFDRDATDQDWTAIFAMLRRQLVRETINADCGRD